MLSSFLIFLALAIPLLAMTQIAGSSTRGRMRARIKRVCNGQAEPSPARENSSTGSVRRQRERTLLGNAGQQLGRFLPRSEILRLRLDQAGLSLPVADCVLGCLGAVVLMTLTLHLVVDLSLLLSIGLSVIVGVGVPHLLLKRRIARRRQQFMVQFPDAIDLIVRGVKSGLPVTESLQAAGDELSNQVGSLFREVTGNIKLGKSLEEALFIVSDKMPILDFRFFVISLTIQQETGGNLAEILQNLVNLMRRRAQVRLRVRALSSEARASAYIIGCLPFVMFGLLYLLDSGYVMRLFHDPRGWVLLAGGCTSLGVGIGIMAKMIRFEI